MKAPSAVTFVGLAPLLYERDLLTRGQSRDRAPDGVGERRAGDRDVGDVGRDPGARAVGDGAGLPDGLRAYGDGIAAVDGHGSAEGEGAVGGDVRRIGAVVDERDLLTRGQSRDRAPDGVDARRASDHDVGDVGGGVCTLVVGHRTGLT